MYSNPGIATLGRIIEVASGQTYEAFMRDRILLPVNMKDSFFFVPPDKADRIAFLYSVKESKLLRAGPEMLGGDATQLRKGAVYSAPEFGLYSTASDLANFYQMMLNGGTWNGKRLLSRASIDAMTQVHTGDLKAGHNPGAGFGLTWEVVKEPLGTITLLSQGTYHHGGAFGTHGWIDAKKDMIGVFLVQGGNASQVKPLFFQMANAAVID
jgi:CubicO group peptidase (beta-lactamase class C family)